MSKILNSKLTAWLAFGLVIILLVLTYAMRTVWWAFIDVFFAFMASFVNLVSVTVRKINPVVSGKLNTWTLIFCVLFVLAFVGEWIAFYNMR
ncbi:MAG: hypothetical protein K2J15_07430 [Muribaculaceae bacterium]|nr:hypothetical protein [Muribaculaceae bacterium]